MSFNSFDNNYLSLSYYSAVHIRPIFLRRVGIFFACGLLAVAALYIIPSIDLSKLPAPPMWNCPLLARLKPLDKSPIQPTDSLELQTFLGKRAQPYTIHIYGDGRIERDTTIALTDFSMGCPLHATDNHLNIPASQALALLDKARDRGFCRLCGLYRSTNKAADGHLETITLNFHGKTHSVSDFSGNPPPLFAELVSSLSAYVSIPEYASSTHPSRERMIECVQYDKSQLEKLQRAHPQ